jgi:toxin ParE1/3/4
LDFISLYRYIAKRSSARIAGGYILRIERACQTLATFPGRGTALGGSSHGLRKMGFERRVTILFRVGEERVEILRILYGGRQVASVEPVP